MAGRGMGLGGPCLPCRRGHRRYRRTAPVRRIGRLPVAGWRRRESSPAAPLYRVAEARGYKGAAGTYRLRAPGRLGRTVQIGILIRDRPGDTADTAAGGILLQSSGGPP